MATEQQIPKLVAILVEHQVSFRSLSAFDAQWVIQNPKEAIAIFNKAIKNRSKSTELLLDFIGTFIVPPIQRLFIARDNFVVDTSKKAKVKISYLGDNFKDNFLEKTEESFADSTLRYGKLKKGSVDRPVIAELGGEAKAETSLAEMFALMEQQPNGEAGVLLTNGYANICYIRDKKGVLWAVDCYWYGGGWRVSADSIEDPIGWFADGQVFSRSFSES